MAKKLLVIYTDDGVPMSETVVCSYHRSVFWGREIASASPDAPKNPHYVKMDSGTTEHCHMCRINSN